MTQRISHQLMTEPHIAGRRISVIQVYKQIMEGDWSRRELARELSLELADIEAAIDYYEANEDRMQTLRERRQTQKESLRRQIAETRPEGITPPSGT